MNRLGKAIAQLESEKRPIATFTIKEISGPDYMSYYRNFETLASFRPYNIHLQEEWEKEQAKLRHSKRKRAKHNENLHQVKFEPRDSLHHYKKPELVARHPAARAECKQLKQQAQAERTELEQQYVALLQDHMVCGVTIARLKAQQADFQTSMLRFCVALVVKSMERNIDLRQAT